MDYEDNLMDTLLDLRDLLLKKHHDYGENNLYKYGMFGIVVRLSDKMARIENLMKTAAEVKDETVRDTFMDVAGYAVAALMLLDEIERKTVNPTSDEKDGKPELANPVTLGARRLEWAHECPRCGSANCTIDASGARFATYQCYDCHAFFTVDTNAGDLYLEISRRLLEPAH